MRETALPAHFTARTLRDAIPTCGMVASVRWSAKLVCHGFVVGILERNHSGRPGATGSNCRFWGPHLLARWIHDLRAGCAGRRDFSGSPRPGGASEPGRGGPELRTVGRDARRDLRRRGPRGLGGLREPGEG